MTANEIDRGGRPRQFDEDPLIARIGGFDDLVLIESALVEHSSRPAWAKGCVNWLWRKRAGDPTGGIHPASEPRYRRMLAELPFDPLKPPGGRRRVLREAASRGSIQFALVSGLAGSGAAVAFAAQTPSNALRAIALLAAPIMPEASGSDSPAEIPGSVVLFRPRVVDGVRECAPDARDVPPPTRVACAPIAVAA